MVQEGTKSTESSQNRYYPGLVRGRWCGLWSMMVGDHPPCWVSADMRGDGTWTWMYVDGDGDVDVGLRLGQRGMEMVIDKWQRQ